MSEKDKATGKASVKTLAIRLEPELHAQLAVIAQLQGSTITDEIRQAIEAHVELKRSDGALAGQASAALEEIEREADIRKEALTALFGNGDADKPTPRSRGGRKATTGEATSDS